MKKKEYIELTNVSDFMDCQSTEIRLEYGVIVNMLEAEGRLSMPFGEKISGRNLFAIRVINAGNIRIFYAYGKQNDIYGIHAYIKKTRAIPQKEMKQAMVKYVLKNGT